MEFGMMEFGVMEFGTMEFGAMEFGAKNNCDGENASSQCLPSKPVMAGWFG